MPEFAGRVHAYYKFPVRLPAGKKREWVVAQLRERWGIEAGSVYWPPCHLTPFTSESWAYGLGDFPVAEEVLAQVVSLPMFPGLSDEAVERVCCSLTEILQSQKEIVVTANNRVLVLAPHTDDGELGCGGTISRMVEEGREVYYAAFSTAAESVPPPFPPDILEKEVRGGHKGAGDPCGESAGL